ncbi:MAG: TetR family transcriptional regulator [Firmicutes bacterium]|nr:TetR family transcriptional regulator [Bacillota bacterium]MCL5056782.1 TetR family transcriptional regulator [Actinomycetota bacterium]
MAKRTGEKYQAIIEAAVKVIAGSGYHNAQVTRIAKEAGVADGTIYLYFENKEDVLISLFRTKMGQFTASAEKELSNLEDPFEMLARLIHLHFSRLQGDRNLAAVLQIELRQSDPSIRKNISQIIKEYYNLIEQIIKYGIDRGSFSPCMNPNVARKIVFGSLDEVATCWVLSARRYSLTDLTVPVYELIARGLSTDGKAPPFPVEILPLH